jgi:hypothetical protein
LLFKISFSFLELRNNQNVGGNYYNKPFFKFEGQENSPDTKVKICFSNAQSRAAYDSGFIALNKDFVSQTPQQGFIYQCQTNSYLVSGSLIIGINIEIETKQSCSEIGKRLMEQKGNLVDDLNAFIGNKEISDFTYRVDGEEFPVHKAILAGELKL